MNGNPAISFTVYINDQGQVAVDAPEAVLTNKVLAFGMLVGAALAINAYKPSPIIQTPRPGLVPGQG